jgi:Na+-translocating ferredoxin:NAD+ oxidoreductase RnfD subunit
MAVFAFFVPSVSWWGVAWGRISGEILASILFVVVILAGIFILWRQSRWHEALSFLVSYAVLLTLLFWWNGIPAGRLGGVIYPLVVDATVIFFATVMLIEPLTSTFPRFRDRVCYGVGVGFFAVVMTYLSGVVSWADVDPLIFGLLLGNLAASLLFLPSRKPTPAPSAAPTTASIENRIP